MNKNLIFIFIITSGMLVLNQFSISFAEVEPIMITISGSMNKIEFDGKWTFFSEWKESSVNSISDKVIIRSSHQDNFVYIFVDVLHDRTLDSGSDKSTICFDPNNMKSLIPNEDNYCFTAILNHDKGDTMKGNPKSITDNYFEKIPNHEELIAIGGISDSNDRYTQIPHPGYEFKIPTDLIKRSNHYGFYLETFDATTNQSLFWPPDIIEKNQTNIPNPKYWGDLISPDKSLPEFPFPIVFLIIMIFSVIIMSRKLYHENLRINIH